MRATVVTPSSLVEVYDVDLPATATDAEVLAATVPIAPIESARHPAGEVFISWREHAGLDGIAAELTSARAAYERATEQAKAALEDAAAGGLSESQLADKLGVDRTTIRRWRGK